MKFMMVLVGVLTTSLVAAAGYVALSIEGVSSLPELSESQFNIQVLNQPLATEYRKQVEAILGGSLDDCEDKSIKQMKVTTLSGVIFYAIHTNEDHCDGGNSFGIIVNSQKQTIGHIYDGDFYQP